MKIPVFRKGEWIEYEPPREVPGGWQKQHSFQAASIFASARSKGSSPKEAACLAEMYIFKQLFPGIQYDTKFESKLEMLFNHEEIASDPTKSGKIEMYEQKTQQD
jgi:hypothetical protein